MSPNQAGKPLPYLSVFRTPGSGKLSLVILSARLETWPTHFADGRDRYCLKALNRACRFCSAGHRPRSEWYAIAQAYPSSAVGIGVITAGAYTYCPDLHDLKDQARGRVIYLERKSGPKSAVKATVDERRLPESKLPLTSLVLKDALWQLWKIGEELALLDQVEAQQRGDRRDEIPLPEATDPSTLGRAIDPFDDLLASLAGGSGNRILPANPNHLSNGYRNTD